MYLHNSQHGVTDPYGQFSITQVPVDPVHLIAEGATVITLGEWPTLSQNIITVAGANNTLPAPIYMVKLDTANAQMVGGVDVDYTLSEVPGFKLTVKAGSVTFPDGSKVGQISVTPVNASKVPMAPPNGMQPQFIVTIQPAGAVFDPPAPLTLPNVDGHAPGSEVEMYSFDHDLEEFVTIGLGTVSADGSVIESNPGVGVVKAGWHCGSQPGGAGDSYFCADCYKCVRGQNGILGAECVLKYNKANQCCKKDGAGGLIADKPTFIDLNTCPNPWPKPLPYDPYAPKHVDGCYGTCNADKSACDAALGRGAAAACEDWAVAIAAISLTSPVPPAYELSYGNCKSWASQYEIAVRIFGGSAYDDAQKVGCQCCK